jgi:nucleotide-binding universal stress UspA family protein
VITDIIVKLEQDKAHDQALDYAVSVAEAFDAHLAGVAFGDLSSIPDYAMPGLPSSIVDEMLAESEKAGRNTIARFEAAVKRSMLPAEGHLITRSDFGPVEAFAVKARNYDLSILRQSEDGAVNNDLLIEAALFDTGRPVIVVPYIQRTGLKLDRMVCCWDGGTAATRAINDALPLLKKAKVVEVLIFANEKGRRRRQREIPGMDIANHLARHKIKIELRTVPAGGIEIADSILSYVADNSADMVVMGGYGHSRLREFVLGGVTRGILSTMTIPVFMSH